MKATWETTLNATLVVCALTITGLVVRREFLTPPAGPTRADETQPTFIEDWQAHFDDGVQLGSSNAAIKIIEFADFECPFCATLHQTLKTLRTRYPTQVALAYVHFPLPMHRFAEPAARVAECAAEQGRFEAMHDRLFENQKQFGLKAWSEFAADAAVPDLSAFETCVRATSAVPRISAGRKLGEQLDIEGTPTLIVNGWKLGRPPDLQQLDALVKAVLAGDSPVSPR